MYNKWNNMYVCACVCVVCMMRGQVIVYYLIVALGRIGAFHEAIAGMLRKSGGGCSNNQNPNVPSICKQALNLHRHIAQIISVM